MSGSASSRALALAALATSLAVAVSGERGDQAVASSTHTFSRGQTIPFLAPAPYLSIDRDLPVAVRNRIARTQRELFERAKKAAQIPATRARGCKVSGSGSLGPPAPHLDLQRILGHHVEVMFTYPRLPRSPACRPWDLTVVVFSGAKATPTYKNWVEDFWIRGARGRLVLDLPWTGQPSYRLLVSATAITGRRGPALERPLRCPGTGDAVRGCLPGYRPTKRGFQMPKPVLPIRALDRTTLEASLRYVLADERARPIVQAVPRSARCPSLVTCVVTYVDPAFPRAPYRIRYRIAGQQVQSCWMALRVGAIDPLPFEDAYIGRLELSACGAWLR